MISRALVVVACLPLLLSLLIHVVWLFSAGEAVVSFHGPWWGRLWWVAGYAVALGLVVLWLIG